MICSTNFSSKAGLLAALFLFATLWGCGGYKTEITVFLPQFGEAGKKAETVELTGAPSLTRNVLITVLPVDNLSGTRAPLNEISRSLRTGLRLKGFRVLDNDTFELFRKKHRMRYTGGVSTKISQAIQEETGADAFLITSLEAYHELDPPQISLISRLVSSGSQPDIVWIDSVGLSGDESPGLLGLNRINDPGLLMNKAVNQLIGSLTAYIDSDGFETGALSVHSGTTVDPGSTTPPAIRWKRKYLPYDYFRSPIIDPDRNYSIAVIPMLDLAVRKNAGKIVSLHYIRELHQLTNCYVIEPGVVREELLRFRAIMPAGPSLAIADLITSPNSLDADLVLSGKVFDYQDSTINPKVDFSVQIIEKQSREIVFGARTFSNGDKGVFFFDYGRVFTAHNLLEEMTRTTTQLFSAHNLPQEITDKYDYIALLPAEKEGNEGYAATVKKIQNNNLKQPYFVVLTKEGNGLNEL